MWVVCGVRQQFFAYNVVLVRLYLYKERVVTVDNELLHAWPVCWIIGQPG